MTWQQTLSIFLLALLAGNIAESITWAFVAGIGPSQTPQGLGTLLSDGIKWFPCFILAAGAAAGATWITTTLWKNARETALWTTIAATTAAVLAAFSFMEIQQAKQTIAESRNPGQTLILRHRGGWITAAKDGQIHHLRSVPRITFQNGQGILHPEKPLP